MKLVLALLLSSSSLAFGMACRNEPSCIKDSVEQLRYTLKNTGYGSYCEEGSLNINDVLFKLSEKVGKLKLISVVSQSTQTCLVIAE